MAVLDWKQWLLCDKGHSQKVLPKDTPTESLAQEHTQEKPRGSRAGRTRDLQVTGSHTLPLSHAEPLPMSDSIFCTILSSKPAAVVSLNPILGCLCFSFYNMFFKSPYLYPCHKSLARFFVWFIFQFNAILTIRLYHGGQ